MGKYDDVGSRDEGLDKGIGIFKVSISISIKGLPFYKSQSRKRDWHSESLDFLNSGLAHQLKNM